MSLTDIMSGSGQANWQTWALLLFAVAFAAIVLRVLLRSKCEIARQAHLPLDDDDSHPAAQKPAHTTAGERR